MRRLPQSLDGSVRQLLELQDQPQTCSIYSSILRQCIDSRAPLGVGRVVHDHIASHGLDRGCFLGNLMLQMYAACGGSGADAESVLARLLEPDVFSWNMVMAAYANKGQLQEARRIFELSRRKNVVSWTIVMAAFSQSGRIREAGTMFQAMPQHNLVSQTAMIRALGQRGDFRSARRLFETMEERNLVSWNTVVVIYAQVAMVDAAITVLERAPGWDLISWTTMLAAYAQRGDLCKAREIFHWMKHRSEAPWNAMIQAYAEAGEIDRASEMFERIPMRDIITSTTMVDAYAQVGDLAVARAIFDEMPERNSVTWSVLISAYAKNSGRESLRLFLRMDLEGFRAEEMTYVAVLDACSSAAAVAEGRIIHESVSDRGLGRDLRIGSALVDFYGKCGQLETARMIFSELPIQDVILWTALITSYAHNGHLPEALAIFREMLLAGILPDCVTIVSVLSACSHGGVEGDGWIHVVRMAWDYDLELSLAHYLCVMDLLGRSGKLELLEDLVTSMPFEPDAVAWTTFLSACKEIGDESRATRAARKLREMDSNAMAPYALLSNMHAGVANAED
ncbi:pentatricopeptide repeat-containing protein At4g02750 [Selaginella moellendorffii]|nr:pentatricopeptide repeat-containing protein At4g02750 [Selaginella moellendorffii]|eukprot:XP_002989284.2 pentatricopeptide repeat-containing protein At4g02750 [Selaginella moellendorffii]